MLRLLITGKCNLNCSYCQMKMLMRNGKLADISLEDIDLLLDKIATDRYDYITIHFSGGEPLLATDIIQYVCEAVESRSIKNVRFAISTNGTLLSDKSIELLKKYDIQTVVSIDSMNDENSLRRNFAGRSFVKEVLQNVNKAHEQGLKLGISTVFAKQSSADVADFVDRLHNDYSIKSLGFNYQHYSGFEKENIDHSDDYMSEYASALIAVSDRCRLYNIFEEQSNRIIEPLVYRVPRVCHCTSQSSQVTVLPSGMLSPCKTFASANKDVSTCAAWASDEPESVKLFSYWRGRRSDTILECSKCVYRGLCGGGCPYEAYVDGGTIFHADKRYCIVVETLFAHLLDLLEQNDAFADAEINFKDVADEEKLKLLTCRNVDKNKLTASIGHFLES